MLSLSKLVFEVIYTGLGLTTPTEYNKHLIKTQETY